MVRQISKEAVKHLVETCTTWHRDNTEIAPSRLLGVSQLALILFGNPIAWIPNEGRSEMLFFSFAGWDTVTTRDRLKALGLGIHGHFNRPQIGDRILDINIIHVVPHFKSKYERGETIEPTDIITMTEYLQQP